MRILRALRVTSGRRRGSSRPVVVETEAGARLVKLRGAAQGTGPLVAEIIVGALAEAIGLPVPSRSLVYLVDGIEVVDGDDELLDLLHASVGINLGFGYLADARDLTRHELDSISADDRAAILWLDRFVLNPDRTARNPNLVWSAGRFWLIDHGAALGFQYDWSLVNETTPRAVKPEAQPHLFADTVTASDLAIWDEILAARITRELLEAAVSAVPDTFLAPLLPSSWNEEIEVASFWDEEMEDASSANEKTEAASSPNEEREALQRRRAAYVAFLWKRLEAPRPFLVAGPPLPSRGRRPAWVRRSGGD